MIVHSEVPPNLPKNEFGVLGCFGYLLSTRRFEFRWECFEIDFFKFMLVGVQTQKKLMNDVC